MTSSGRECIRARERELGKAGGAGAPPLPRTKPPGCAPRRSFDPGPVPVYNTRMSRRRVRRAPPATCPAGGLWHYSHPDWEGSWRLSSSPSRTVTGDLAYSPYGAASAGSGPDDFTGQWVDTPDNLDDFPYRFLQPMMGRWLSPDPSGLAAVNPANPQSWNAYAYVANQPLSATDPLGLNGNGSTGCGVGQPADGACPIITIVVNDRQCASCPNPGPPPAWVSANLQSVGYCSASPDACLAAGLSQHSNGPGSAGGGGNGNGLVAAAMASPKGPSCSQFQKAAGALAARFETLSSGLGWTADGAGLAAFVSFLGEAPSLGADSPLTLGLAATTETLYQASTYTGAAAAALGGFAAGNVASIGAFDWSHLVGMATEAAASDIPGLSNLAETIGGMAEQASGLALAAQEACQ